MSKCVGRLKLAAPKRGWTGKGKTAQAALAQVGSKVIKAVLALVQQLNCPVKECPAGAQCETFIKMNDAITISKRGAHYICTFAGAVKVSCGCAGGVPPNPKPGLA